MKDISLKFMFSLEKLHDLHNALPFTMLYNAFSITIERMKIEKVEKLVANLHDITKHGILFEL